MGSLSEPCLIPYFVVCDTHCCTQPCALDACHLNTSMSSQHSHQPYDRHL